MDKCNIFEMYQDEIELAKLIRTICHPLDDDKQYFMAVVETDKQDYLFNPTPLSV